MNNKDFTIEEKWEYEPKSSFIKEIIYSCGKNKICEKINIIFIDGKHLEYSPNISILNEDLFELFERFIASESVGKFWHKNIKDNFPVKRIK